MAKPKYLKEKADEAREDLRHGLERIINILSWQNLGGIGNSYF